MTDNEAFAYMLVMSTASAVVAYYFGRQHTIKLCRRIARHGKPSVLDQVFADESDSTMPKGELHTLNAREREQ